MTSFDTAPVQAVLDNFAGFMFNKAHSAEYALEAFQGAWLKRRWPAHYIAAILSNYRGFYAHSPTLAQIRAGAAHYWWRTTAVEPGSGPAP